MTILLTLVALLMGGHHHHYHCYHHSGNVACYYNRTERHITLHCSPLGRKHVRCVQVG